MAVGVVVEEAQLMSTVNVLIISAGKYGREVVGWVKHAIEHGSPWRLKGFLDNRPNILDGINCRVPIIAAPESYEPKPGDGFICALGKPQDKKRYAEMFTPRGAEFINLIHPSVIIGERITMGHGIILAPYSAFTCDLSLGDFVSYSSFSGAGHDSRTMAYCQISSNCSINGNAVLEEGVFLGANVCVLPSARIGAWAYVGAGSIVLKHVAPRSKVFGNPAVPIGIVDLSA
jgi:sugar O-acyltransferase (sialic acid O-acetyltransferase NeuD family)